MRRTRSIVTAGQDRFGEHRGLGVSVIAFKVVPATTDGMLIIENVFHARAARPAICTSSRTSGSTPPKANSSLRWATARYELHAGDSLLAPRNVPHVWAHVGDGAGRMLIAFLPAGKMEAFFRIVTQANAMPPQDPQLWRAHGMELLGPPLDPPRGFSRAPALQPAPGSRRSAKAGGAR